MLALLEHLPGEVLHNRCNNPQSREPRQDAQSTETQQTRDVANQQEQGRELGN